MKIAVRVLLCATLAICGYATPTLAETVKIPVGEQSAGMEIEKPTLGMSKAMVEKRYGAPQERIAPRGQPPISRWVYQDFIVYFEYDTVLHSVVRFHPKDNP